jgi:isoleucyl-tRNA synthetase
VLGPRYGKQLGQISKALAETDGTAAVAAFDRGETITLKVGEMDVELSRDDVLIETVQKPGLIAQEERDVTVALDTVLTEELLQEGFAREVISKLQTMRKDAGFDVVDRIHVTCQADAELTAAINAHQGMINDVVLAESFTFEKAPEGAYAQNWDINGKEAALSVRKA